MRSKESTVFDLNRLKELETEMKEIRQKFPVRKPELGHTYWTVTQNAQTGVFQLQSANCQPAQGYNPKYAFHTQTKAQEFSDALNAYMKELSGDVD